MGWVISVPLVALALYQCYASGFGLIRGLLHRGIFLAFLLGLLFSWRRATTTNVAPKAWYRFDGVSINDIALAVLGVTAALYLPLLPPAACRRLPTRRQPGPVRHLYGHRTVALDAGGQVPL